MEIEELLKKIADLVSEYETKKETIVGVEIRLGDGLIYDYDGEKFCVLGLPSTNGKMKSMNN